MKTVKKLLMMTAIVSLAACNTPVNPDPDPQPTEEALAFPEAEGGGKYATGGRKGTIYYVTSLEDQVLEPKSGTLRYALDQNVARIILFKVSGRIDLKGELKIRYGNVTIAGQTAPGTGICISGYPVTINADNVILRYLHFRMGDEHGVEGDALGGTKHKNIIIDHCSCSWSTDECASFYANTNFTMQWCIISESLKNSVHVKGNHGYGGIWGGTNATFHHNLLAHHDSRNPRFDHDYVDKTCHGPLDHVNNVIYNWGGNSAYGGESVSEPRCINMVNNYYKSGPNSKHTNRIVNPTTSCTYCSTDGHVVPGKFFVNGNFVNGFEAVSADNSKGVEPDDKSQLSECLSDKRWTDGLTKLSNEQTAEEAYVSVLEKAGCSKVRDAIDERIVASVKAGNGSIINSQEEVGGWPEYSNYNPTTGENEIYPEDSDNDGIPDDWEVANGLNPNSFLDGNKTTLQAPYTNVEVYINSLAQKGK